MIKNKYTISICDYPTLSENGKKCLDSIARFLPYDRFELIYISGNSSHAVKLNMAINSCKTKYLCFLDNDTEFTKENVHIFDKLDEFWEKHENDAGSICYGELPCGVSDESSKTPYINFYFTCYNTKVGAKFDENFKYSQCLDVAFQRFIRYLGWNNYGANWMNPLHHHKDKSGTTKYDNYVKENQLKMIEMFGCPTDGLPEEYMGWLPFEEYLYRQYCSIIPFKKKGEK